MTINQNHELQIMPRPSPTSLVLLRGGLVLFCLVLVIMAGKLGQRPVAVEPIAKSPAPPATQSEPAAKQFATNEAAVQFAFERFAAEQHEDGSWGARDDAGEAIEPATTETTSLVLLAFASAGQTHRQGKYADNVQHGLDYLLNAGKVDDELRPRRLMLPARGHTTRSQALATLAMGRLYSITRDTQWFRAQQFAVTELGEPGHWPREGAALQEDVENETVFWQRLALGELFFSNIPISPEAILALKKWYQAQPPASQKTPWFGNHYIGLHTFRYRPREEIDAQFMQLTELPCESLPVAEQFCAGEALRLSYYSEAGPGIHRLKDVALAQFESGSPLEEMAIRVMILQIRLPKFIRSLHVPEDDFPLMTKHEDL